MAQSEFFQLPRPRTGKRHVSVVIRDWKGWRVTRLRETMGDLYQEDKMLWEALGNEFFRITFLHWDWDGCEDTMPEQWCRLARFQIHDAEVKTDWAAASTLEQAHRRNERMLETFALNL